MTDVLAFNGCRTSTIDRGTGSSPSVGVYYDWHGHLPPSRDLRQVVTEALEVPPELADRMVGHVHHNRYFHTLWMPLDRRKTDASHPGHGAPDDWPADPRPLPREPGQVRVLAARGPGRTRRTASARQAVWLWRWTTAG